MSKTPFNSGAGNLILVRHGETEGQSSIRYHGRTDVALDERGRAQMRAAARALEREIFSKVFASSLSRATAGARIIAGDDAPIVAIEEFVEIDFGKFEGLTLERDPRSASGRVRTMARDAPSADLRVSRR